MRTASERTSRRTLARSVARFPGECGRLKCNAIVALPLSAGHFVWRSDLPMVTNAPENIFLHLERLMSQPKRFVSLLIACAAAFPVAAQDWPQWRGPKRDAHVAGFTAPASWPKT